MATVLPRPEPVASDRDQIPLLLPGDHLDRAEFHARYELMPRDTFAELVGGIVYMPALYPPHGEAHAEVILWLGLYKAGTPGLRLYDNTTIFLADDGEPQPDACLILPSRHGGTARIEGRYLAGPPDLVVEVAYSSVSYDLHSKKRDYERAGVREYVVVMLQEDQVRWFALEDGVYHDLPPGEDGLFRSELFPGLWLDPAALLRLDSAAVRTALERGLATPEHADFARRLGE